MQQLSPSEYRARWSEADERDGRAILVDVREDWELAIARVPRALHIPMAQIPERIEELRDAGVPVVVMCHAGGRSARVAQFLESRGFAQVYNLRGGITAWSHELDPDIPVY